MPAATVGLTFTVMIVFPPPRARLAAENCAVIPGGIPLAENVTVDAKPAPGVRLMTLVPDIPGASVTLAGDSVSVNDEGEVTATETTAVPVKIPLVPVNVIG